jgi:hypothetical protein
VAQTSVAAPNVAPGEEALLPAGQR